MNLKWLSTGCRSLAARHREARAGGSAMLHLEPDVRRVAGSHVQRASATGCLSPGSGGAAAALKSERAYGLHLAGNAFARPQKRRQRRAPAQAGVVEGCADQCAVQHLLSQCPSAFQEGARLRT